MATKDTPMNHYGRLAQAHWKKHAPNRYAALEDPVEFFTSLGQTIEDQIATITEQADRKVPPDLDYLEKAARMRGNQLQAKEVVLDELVYSVAPETTSLSDELNDMLGGLPTPETITDRLYRIREMAELEAEENNFSQVIYTQEEAAEIQQLETLLPLVSLTTADLDAMSEPEIRDRILALRPFWNPETNSLIDLE